MMTRCGTHTGALLARPHLVGCSHKLFAVNYLCIFSALVFRQFRALGQGFFYARPGLISLQSVGVGNVRLLASSPPGVY